ncbi:hypothetical protein V8F20_004774 [Naviculisporaceae sp. PSN 640]
MTGRGNTPNRGGPRLRGGGRGGRGGSANPNQRIPSHARGNDPGELQGPQGTQPHISYTGTPGPDTVTLGTPLPSTASTQRHQNVSVAPIQLARGHQQDVAVPPIQQQLGRQTSQQNLRRDQYTYPPPPGASSSYAGSVASQYGQYHMHGGSGVPPSEYGSLPSVSGDQGRPASSWKPGSIHSSQIDPGLDAIQDTIETGTERSYRTTSSQNVDRSMPPPPRPTSVKSGSTSVKSGYRPQSQASSSFRPSDTSSAHQTPSERRQDRSGSQPTDRQDRSGSQSASQSGSHSTHRQTRVPDITVTADADNSTWSGIGTSVAASSRGQLSPSTVASKAIPRHKSLANMSGRQASPAIGSNRSTSYAAALSAPAPQHTASQSQHTASQSQQTTSRADQSHQSQDQMSNWGDDDFQDDDDNIGQDDDGNIDHPDDAFDQFVYDAENRQHDQSTSDNAQRIQSRRQRDVAEMHGAQEAAYAEQHSRQRRHPKDTGGPLEELFPNHFKEPSRHNLWLLRDSGDAPIRLGFNPETDEFDPNTPETPGTPEPSGRRRNSGQMTTDIGGINVPVDQTDVTYFISKESRWTCFLYQSNWFSGWIVTQAAPGIDTRSARFKTLRVYSKEVHKNCKHDFLNRLLKWFQTFVIDKPELLNFDLDTPEDQQEFKAMVLPFITEHMFDDVFAFVAKYVDYKATFGDKQDLPFFWLKNIIFDMGRLACKIIQSEAELNRNRRSAGGGPQSTIRKDMNKRTEYNQLFDALPFHESFKDMDRDVFVEVPEEFIVSRRARGPNLDVLRENTMNREEPPPKKRNQHPNAGSWRGMPTSSPTAQATTSANRNTRGETTLPVRGGGRGGGGTGTVRRHAPPSALRRSLDDDPDDDDDGQGLFVPQTRRQQRQNPGNDGNDPTESRTVSAYQESQ